MVKNKKVVYVKAYSNSDAKQLANARNKNWSAMSAQLNTKPTTLREYRVMMRRKK